MKNSPIKNQHPWIDKQRITLEGSFSVFPYLAKIIHEYKLSSQKDGYPAFVFDLDSTLFEVRFRALHILREFAQERLCPEKDFLHYEWLKKLSPWRMLYSLRDTASINAYPGTMGGSIHLLKELESYWRKRFFSSEYLFYDVPVVGAPSYVRSIDSSGVHVIYLTGRDEAVREGTELSLQHWGFPKGKLLMKPSFYEDDAAFKGRAMAASREEFNVLAFFDNEPANFYHFEKSFPEAQFVFIHSLCSKKIAKNVRSIMRINNFFV